MVLLGADAAAAGRNAMPPKKAALVPGGGGVLSHELAATGGGCLPLTRVGCAGASPRATRSQAWGRTVGRSFLRVPPLVRLQPEAPHRCRVRQSGEDLGQIPPANILPRRRAAVHARLR